MSFLIGNSFWYIDKKVETDPDVMEKMKMGKDIIYTTGTTAT